MVKTKGKPGPQPKLGGRIDRHVRLSAEVVQLLDKDAATIGPDGKAIGVSDVAEQVFRQYYGLPPIKPQH